MGRMQFIVPDRQRLAAGAIELAYIANHDESPCQTAHELAGRFARRGPRGSRIRHVDNSMAGVRPGSVGARRRARSSSGRVRICCRWSWRGTLSRLRTYAFVWAELGLALPDDLHPLVKQASHEMALAATMQSQPDRAATHADRALKRRLTPARFCAPLIANRLGACRKSNMPNVPILVGATLDERAVDPAFADHLLPACNTLAVPLTWSAIEAVQGAPVWDRSDEQVAWCQAHELRICSGPLLKLDADTLPSWIQSQTDFDTLLSYVGATPASGGSTVSRADSALELRSQSPNRQSACAY